MIDNVPISSRGWRNWLRAALQPMTLLYVFVIPVLWAALAAIYVSPTALLVALLIFGYFFIVRHRMGLAAREALIAKQKFHLNSALANMPQGLCMYDGERRLIVCNRHYADLYGLSEEQTRPGTPFEAIIRHQVSIGNVSENPEEYIANRLRAVYEKTDYQLTTRLRDGRLVSVVHRPMDGGGWVSTHTDVTEQVKREETFRLLFEGSPVPAWVIDRESLRFVAVNDAAIAHYGYSREQFLAMTVSQLRPKDDRKRFGDFLRTLQPDQFVQNIGQHITADGTIIDIAVYSRALTYAGRSARLTVVHDISISKRVENELRRTQNFLDAIIEHVPMPILVKDVAGADGDVSQCSYSLINRACEELFGVDRAEFVGKTAAQLFSKEIADFIVTQSNAALRLQTPRILSDHEVPTATNGTQICTSTTVAVRDDAQAPQYLVTVIQDVTERQRAERHIAQMAHYDHLTGLANRRTFNDTMEATIRHAADRGEQFTILSLDLDGFKETNDTHGHLVGDALLFEVSRRLIDAADGAFVARIGGDEFALIANGGAPTAVSLADRLLKSFKEEIHIEDRPIKTGATIGAAVYPDHGDDSKNSHQQRRHRALPRQRRGPRLNSILRCKNGRTHSRAPCAAGCAACRDRAPAAAFALSAATDDVGGAGRI